VCCSVLQCVVVCCSVLQCVAVYYDREHVAQGTTICDFLIRLCDAVNLISK